MSNEEGIDNRFYLCPISFAFEIFHPIPSASLSYGARSGLAE